MRYLVTGGAGFIGSNIVRKLLQQGETVRVLDNFSSGREINLADIKNDIELIDGDIRDYWTVVDAVKDVDYILHQAALPSVPRSVANPLTSNSVNIDGTLNVMEAARHAGVKRMVMASSSSVYGDSETLPKHEGMTPSPLSGYAITKLTNEYYARVYYQLYGFETVCLRYFNIFGPHQDPNSFYAAVIPKFISAFAEGRQPVVFGDGLQSRDFTYIDNCVQANLLAVKADGVAGDYFNVACGGQFTLNQLLDKLREIMGVDIKAKYDPPRPGDIKHSYASIEKFAKFGFDPKVDFDEGLKRTVDFFTGTGKRASVKA